MYKDPSEQTTLCWGIFRLIFVVFSLYLLGDVFYRWDGFKYYASFREFVPNVALISILWSMVAACTAVLVWLSLEIIQWLFVRIGLKIRIAHLIILMCFTVLFGALIWWKGRYLIISQFGWTLQLKLIVFLCVVFAAIFCTWIFRNKVDLIIRFIHARITPLVWLFCILVILSVPVAGYQLLHKEYHDGIQRTLQLTVKDSVDNSRPNIILVIFDAMTARDMSVYGYDRETTPFITEWVKNASLFKRLQAASNFTTPTIASLMTGKRLWTHQLYTPHAKKPVKSDIENLALVLKNNGYYNMAFIGNEYASVVKLDIADSFDIAPSPVVFNMPDSFIGTVDKFIYRLFVDKFILYDWIIKRDFILFRVLNIFSRDVKKTVVPPEKVFNEFLSNIEDNVQEPYFAWIHLYPPHDPYLATEPYMGMFAPSEELRTLKSQSELVKTARKNRQLKEFPKELQPKIDLLRARYNEYIRYCDSQFENFIKQLSLKNKLQNTIVILTSDHGESFEHNYLKHGFDELYEQVTHIPLIIKEPDQSQGRIVHNIVEQIDITTTILDLANIPAPSWMEGRSLMPLMRGDMASGRPVFLMAFGASSRGYPITRGTIAVWEEDYKLMHYLAEEKSLLFNIQQDPEELNNLFDTETVVSQRLLSLIEDNLEKANEKISRGNH